MKRVDQRHENQLFIRSLLGACEGNKSVKVVAVGVESPTELQCVLDLGSMVFKGERLPMKYRFGLLLKQFYPKSSPVSKVRIGRRNRWRKKHLIDS